MNRTELTSLLGCLSLALACSSKVVGDGSGAVHPVAADLDGRTFVSTSVTGYDLLAGTEIRLGFHGNELRANAGCNGMSGPYRIEGGILRVSTLASTLIGCIPDTRQAQDGWLADLLQSSPAITLDEPELELRGESASITFLDREVASPDRPLSGTLWVLGGRGSGLGVEGGLGFDRATLTFDEAGTVAVFTACQSGTGRYTADATTIQFEGLSYDGAACSDPTLERVSGFVLSVLDGAPVIYSIEEASLTVEQGDESLYFDARE